MMQNKYVFDPYPLQVTMQRLAENLKTRRLEKKLSTKSLRDERRSSFVYSAF